MAADLEILLLGGLQIRHNGSVVTQFMSSKAPALLAYLAVTGRPHQRDALAGLLWGEMPDAAAANNLRQVLSNLRKLFDPHLLITRDTVAFNQATPHSLDTETFGDLLRLSSGQPAGRRAGLLRQALALYSGDFLEGFYVRDAPDFEDWALVQRVRLRQLALNALGSLTQLMLDSGAFQEAIGSAAQLLAMEPWSEEAHRQRMLALARSGQHSAALAQYRTCRETLQKEFGAEPTPETTALFQRIRAATGTTRHNLPAPVTGFVGREEEMAELRRLLAQPRTRLLTILGPGGVGKTRLALEVARHCAPMFLNGVRLAPLANVASPQALPTALAAALAFVPAGAEPLATQLLNFLRGKEMLLVLDNFEHLAATPALDLLAGIVQQAPDVKLLITSRARLNLAAEQLFDLTGLPCPPETERDGVQDFAAVELFIRRSQRIRSDFTISPEALSSVARICRMTEGLPLAIEMAAAWSRSMTPAEIVDDLARGLALLASSARDLPARHRSMAAVFEHSWVLLDEACQTALVQLSVCRGGFDRAAAQVIAGAGMPLLQTLVDRSLLRVDAAGRFDMHPMIQQFAAEKLAECAEADAAATCQRHARHFAALTGDREGEFHGAQDRQALRWMQREADNIRVAWDWGVRQADGDLLECFVESFLYFFDIQGRYRECVELTGEALDVLRTRNPVSQRNRVSTGRVLALQAGFRFRLGEFEGARQDSEQALTLLEPSRPHRDVGHARLYLGAAWYGLGNLDRAVDCFLQAVQTYQEVGHAWGIGAALDNTGYLEMLRGNLSAAETHLTRALAVAEGTGSRYLLTGVNEHLATLRAAQGRLAEALSHVERCRQVLEELDRPYIVANLSLSLSQIALQAGDPDAAEEHIDRALKIARDTGNRLDLGRFLIQAGAVAEQRGQHTAALAAYSEAAAVAREMHAESLLVDVVCGLADLASTADAPANGAALYRLAAQHPAASQETAAHASAALDRLPAHARGAQPILALDEAISLGIGRPSLRGVESTK